jgi:hypothetical protein
MGYIKDRRSRVTNSAQTLGTTGGTILAYPSVTVITATDTGTFILPVPQPGLQKTIVIDYVGATGNISLVNQSTATVFNGSTANIITVSSSEDHLVAQLIGVTSAQWAAYAGTTGGGLAFAGSTVVG